MSDRDQWPDNPNEPASVSQNSVPRQGSGNSNGCLKWFLILGSIGFLGVLVCCGGAIWLGMAFMPKVVTSPPEVAALGQKVMTFDMPAEYEGINGLSFDNMVFELSLAEFRRKDGKGSIALTKLRLKLEGGNDQNNPLKNGQFHKTDRPEDLTIQSTEDKKLTIRGKETDVSFSKAKRRGQEGILNVVTVRFDDLKGFDTMVIILDDDVYDEDEVVKMIESIK